MLYPLTRLAAGESQILFDEAPEKLAAAQDDRVRQFVEGQARERLSEMKAEG
jgi:phospholipid/cholesterol/gamma-HCH transport system ATP-binding protein